MAQSEIRPARLFFEIGGSGRDVILLHGWTCDIEDWKQQLPLLRTRYRVVAVDLRGHGDSEVPEPGSYSPESYVDDVEHLIQNELKGRKAIIIGHSMGGQIAARLAKRRPDLVRAVVSVDGSLGFHQNFEPVFVRAAQDLEQGAPAEVAAQLFQLFYDAATPEPLKSLHSERAKRLAPHVIVESFAPLFIGEDQVGVGTGSEFFCRGLTVPVYHICRDPEQADRMATWFPNEMSKVEAWDSAGHWIHQDRPVEINDAIVAWIDGLEH